MAIYSVFEPLEKAIDPEKQAENLLFAKEGFSIWAYALPPVYFLFRRMWVVLACYLVLLTAIVALGKLGGLPDIVTGVMSFGLNLLAGLESRNLYQLSLEKSGYELKDVIVGSSLAECEQSFFAKWEPVPTPEVASAAAHQHATRFGVADGGYRKSSGRGGSRHSAIGSLGGD